MLILFVAVSGLLLGEFLRYWGSTPIRTLPRRERLRASFDLEPMQVIIICVGSAGMFLGALHLAQSLIDAYMLVDRVGAVGTFAGLKGRWIVETAVALALIGCANLVARPLAALLQKRGVQNVW